MISVRSFVLFAFLCCFNACVVVSPCEYDHYYVMLFCCWFDVCLVVLFLGSFFCVYVCCCDLCVLLLLCFVVCVCCCCLCVGLLLCCCVLRADYLLVCVCFIFGVGGVGLVCLSCYVVIMSIV